MFSHWLFYYRTKQAKNKAKRQNILYDYQLVIKILLKCYKKYLVHNLEPSIFDLSNKNDKLMNTTETQTTSSKLYQKAMIIFSRQYKDMVRITRLYVNKDGKVYAGEWIDSKGVINFNAGYALDLVKVIEFKD